MSRGVAGRQTPNLELLRRSEGPLRGGASATPAQIKFEERDAVRRQMHGGELRAADFELET